MKTKKFDNLGIEPSLLGFGCMRFPLDEDGKINEKEAEKMISSIEEMDNLMLCGNTVDDEDKEYLKQAYQKFLMDVRVYNKLKYTSNKYK